MKKKILLLTLIPLAISGLTSCNKSEDPKVILDYGMVHEESFDTVVEIEYSDLRNKVESGDSFIVAISREQGSCGCWDKFQPILVKVMKKYDLDIKQITAEELSKHDDRLGIYTTLGYMPSIVFFKDGKLVRQVIYKDETRKIFNDESGKPLEDLLLENVYLPKIKYVSQTILDSYRSSNKEYDLYIGTSNCPDCTRLNTTVLKEWNKSNKTITNPLYLFDVTSWFKNRWGSQEGKEAYQNIMNEYKLSVENNVNLGYETGFIPTLQHRIGDEVKDMCVVYNDSYKNGTLRTYFTAERVAKMKYLEGTGNQYVITESKLTDEQKKDFDQNQQAKFHDPIAKKYIDYYLK